MFNLTPNHHVFYGDSREEVEADFAGWVRNNPHLAIERIKYVKKKEYYCLHVTTSTATCQRPTVRLL